MRVLLFNGAWISPNTPKLSQHQGVAVTPNILPKHACRMEELGQAPRYHAEFGSGEAADKESDKTSESSRDDLIGQEQRLICQNAFED